MQCKNFKRRNTTGTNRRVEMLENADKLYRDVMLALAAAPNALDKNAMRNWAQLAVRHYTEDMGALWAEAQQRGLV